MILDENAEREALQHFVRLCLEAWREGSIADLAKLCTADIAVFPRAGLEIHGIDELEAFCSRLFENGLPALQCREEEILQNGSMAWLRVILTGRPGTSACKPDRLGALLLADPNHRWRLARLFLQLESKP